MSLIILIIAIALAFSGTDSYEDNENTKYIYIDTSWMKEGDD